MSFPKEFSQDYYDYKYFADEKGKKFKRPNGSEVWWGYQNPTGESTGIKLIVEAWKTMFQPKTMLDVGTGRGTVVAYGRDAEIEAQGFDWSKWAVNEGRYARCKREWLKVHDATKRWPYNNNSFDLVTALDLCEHIYFEDLAFVIDEMYRVAKKWVFLQIATVDSFREKGYILKKGERIPWEDGRTWAGHVTVETESFWYEQLEREDLLPRRDMVNWFVSLVPNDIIKNWLLNTIIVMEIIK